MSAIYENNLSDVIPAFVSEPQRSDRVLHVGIAARLQRHFLPKKVCERMEKKNSVVEVLIIMVYSSRPESGV